MRFILWMGVVIAVVAAAGGVAAGSQEGTVQSAVGTLVAVTPASRTVVVESALDGQPWTIGAEVTEETRFGGKAKGFQDLREGERVKIQWTREEDRLVARSVTEE